MRVVSMARAAALAGMVLAASTGLASAEKDDAFHEWIGETCEEQNMWTLVSACLVLAFSLAFGVRYVAQRWCYGHGSRGNDVLLWLWWLATCVVVLPARDRPECATPPPRHVRTPHPVHATGRAVPQGANTPMLVPFVRCRCCDAALAAMCGREWLRGHERRQRARRMFIGTGRTYFHPYTPATRTTAVGCARCLRYGRHVPA